VDRRRVRFSCMALKFFRGGMFNNPLKYVEKIPCSACKRRKRLVRDSVARVVFFPVSARRFEASILFFSTSTLLRTPAYIRHAQRPPLSRHPCGFSPRRTETFSNTIDPCGDDQWCARREDDGLQVSGDFLRTLQLGSYYIYTVFLSGISPVGGGGLRLA